jgi:hypothetical protein
MNDEIAGHDELIDRAARALAALPPANALATARIVSAVRARRAHRNPVWRRAAGWLTETYVSARAAGLLAAASLVLGFVVRGAMSASGSAPPAAAAATGGSADSPGVGLVPAAVGARGVAVSFVFDAPQAASVAVVGDFNGWDPLAAPMQQYGASGPWTASVLARPGRHTYAFLVDGVLVPDPHAPRARSLDYGRDASVLLVRAP